MYSITIKKESARVIKKQEWVAIERRGEDTKYGYAPEKEEIKIEEVEIYFQSVEFLDLVRVIAAVNYQGEPSHPDDDRPRPYAVIIP